MFTWLKGRKSAPAAATITPKQQEVLASKYCGKCSKNCKLSEPKCGRGKKQANRI